MKLPSFAFLCVVFAAMLLFSAIDSMSSKEKVVPLPRSSTNSLRAEVLHGDNWEHSPAAMRIVDNTVRIEVPASDHVTKVRLQVANSDSDEWLVIDLE